MVILHHLNNFTGRFNKGDVVMKRFLKWLAYGLLVLVILAVAFLGGPAGYEWATGLSATQFTNRTFPAGDGTTLHGYLAEPAGAGPHPAVLLIHEWWGLNEDITKIADALAAEGYVVLAADSYRGQTTNEVSRALYFVTNIPAEQINADLDSALAYLRGLPNVDPGRVATMGFCFGGRQSFGLGTRHPDLAAVVDYYGGGVTVNTTADLGQLNAPFLGIFGETDSSIPLEEIDRLQKILTEKGLTHQITIYPGVGHAFLNSENLADPSHPAGQAWQQTVRFLATHLAE